MTSVSQSTAFHQSLIDIALLKNPAHKQFHPTKAKRIHPYHLYNPEAFCILPFPSLIDY
jgi:hypothetical protein